MTAFLRPAPVRRALRPVLALLLGLPSLAGAEPLRPAAPSFFATNRAAMMPALSHAPRVVDRADALAADAEAAARLPAFVGAEPDPVDYYAGLDDPVLTRHALDVPAVAARRSGAAWDWLTLAEIALDMSLGDHDENGNPIRRPDAFALEALADTAAGAALNGFVRAQSAGEGVSALALMVRALETGGDGATAGRVALAAKRFFPNPEGTDYETDITALLRLIEAPPPLPDAPPEDTPSPTARAGDWLLTCSVGRDCVIQSDTDGLSLEISRNAGPGAPVAITLVLAGSGWGNLNATPETPRPEASLSVDARPLYPEAARLEFRQGASAMEGWAYFSVPPVRLKAALDALLGGEKLTLTGTAANGAELRVDTSLPGLRALARQMDALQGRIGTETALVERGTAPATGAPAAPRARVIPAPVFAPNWSQEPVPLTKPGHSVWQKHCPGAGGEGLDAVALPDGGALHLRACPDAAHPAGFAAFISRGNQTEPFATPAGKVLKWDNGLFQAGPPGGAHTGAEAPAPLSLTGIVQGDDYGTPCPAIETYVWTGTRLAPALITGLTDCRASRRAAPLIRALVQEIAK